MQISPQPVNQQISRVTSRSQSEKGFTLIELLVVIAIIAIVLGAAATGLKQLLNMNLKQASSHLGATLRYLSNKAVTEHRFYRIVLNLDGQEYYVEESEKPFTVSMTDNAEKNADKIKKNKKESAEEGEEVSEEDKESSSTQEVTSKLLKRSKLPSGVYFKDVFVAYQQNKIEKGLAYAYFFPDGFSTPTMINLRNEKDSKQFSIELKAMTGQTSVEGHYREASH